MCNYYPPGNYPGRPVYLSGPTGSKCPNQVENGLCLDWSLLNTKYNELLKKNNRCTRIKMFVENPKICVVWLQFFKVLLAFF